MKEEEKKESQAWLLVKTVAYLAVAVYGCYLIFK